MDDDLRSRLFDPPGARALILAHRPPGASAVDAVVSDAVWREVVGLLRWTAASTTGAPHLDPGRWWRLAAACADLLRRMPAFCDELGQQCDRPAVPEAEEPDGMARVERSAERLLDLLRHRTPVALGTLAAEVDELGAAAIAVYAGPSSWALP